MIPKEAERINSGNMCFILTQTANADCLTTLERLLRRGTLHELVDLNMFRKTYMCL